MNMIMELLIISASALTAIIVSLKWEKHLKRWDQRPPWERLENWTHLDGGSEWQDEHSSQEEASYQKMGRRVK